MDNIFIFIPMKKKALTTGFKILTLHKKDIVGSAIFWSFCNSNLVISITEFWIVSQCHITRYIWPVLYECQLFFTFIFSCWDLDKPGIHYHISYTSTKRYSQTTADFLALRTTMNDLKVHPWLESSGLFWSQRGVLKVLYL